MPPFTQNSFITSSSENCRHFSLAVCNPDFYIAMWGRYMKHEYGNIAKCNQYEQFLVDFW